ncbi:hypothetical protein D3C72_2001630 [compost metagenome]
MNFTAGTHLQVSCPLSHQHGQTDHTRQQTKRIEQLEEVAGVEQAHVFIEVERNALQQVAERHAEYHRRHEAADKDAPVPHVAPAAALQLRAVVKTDRAEEQG